MVRSHHHCLNYILFLMCNMALHSTQNYHHAPTIATTRNLHLGYICKKQQILLFFSYTITISCVLSQAGIPCLPLPVQNIHRTPSILSTTTIGCILLRAGVPCLPISVSNHFLHYELPFLFLHLLPLLFFQEYLLCFQLSLYSHT